MPPAYQWLSKLPVLPRMVSEALKEFGVVETPGKANNTTIMAWANEVGEKALGYRYAADEIPWCGLFMAIVAKRAGKPIPYGPLYALNWSSFGYDAKTPILGDVLTFKRNGGGHVALYIAEDDAAYHILGGNQSDKVCFTRIAKERLYKVRRPPFKTAMPASAIKYFISATGKLSTNEA